MGQMQQSGASPKQDTKRKGTVLVVDDQPNMLRTLRVMLEGAGYEVELASGVEQACSAVTRATFDLVLTDLKMGDGSGLDVLAFVRERSPQSSVIFMTAHGTIESAVDAVRRGANDYLQKPFGEEEILLRVENAVTLSRREEEITSMLASFREHYNFENIIGRSKPIRDVLNRITRVAPTPATVLITGESGTGKELVARAIHANSRRADKPFVSINCAAISETLLESELFGHAKGAFTGASSARKGLLEEANGGTFFFDEIAETNMSFQAKLLRAIQEGEIRRLGENKPIHVDIRVIAATNIELKEAIANKEFREDLYYRLNVARFLLPPLRERREDVRILAGHFLKKSNKKMGREVTFSDGALDFLERYDYPGNVRELENLIEQAVALCVDGVLKVDDVVPPELATQAERAPGSLQEVVDRAERDAIEKALVEVEGSRERAAERLGLSPTTLWRKMKRLDVTYP